MKPQIRWKIIRPGTKSNYSLCRCECGTIREVSNHNLKYGGSISCGCLKRELMARRNSERSVHGKTGSPEYTAWVEMRRRCRSINRQGSHRYSGRGIKVCSRWLGQRGFINFLEDMGLKPSEYHTLDRINNDGDYEPTNCRWATQEVQQRNRSDTKNLTFNGRTQCIQAWAKEIGITHFALTLRISKWGVEKALSTPKRHDKVTR